MSAEIETLAIPGIGDLAADLALAQGEIGNAVKGRENPFFKSRYATLSDVWDVCRGPLSKHGLAVIQIPKKTGEGFVLETILAHKSGQFVTSHYPIVPVKNDPQGIGSAITYARRYSLAAMVGVAPAEDDDDGNAASGKTKKEEHKEHVSTVDNYMRQGSTPSEPPPKELTAPDLLAQLSEIKTVEALEEWNKATSKSRGAIKKADPDGYAAVVSAAKALGKTLKEGPEPPADVKLPGDVS